jgi:hypothetical protein
MRDWGKTQPTLSKIKWLQTSVQLKCRKRKLDNARKLKSSEKDKGKFVLLIKTGQLSIDPAMSLWYTFKFNFLKHVQQGNIHDSYEV